MKNSDKTTLAPQKIMSTEQETYATSGWKTLIFNCYCHSFDEAVDAIVRATHCSTGEAERLARTAELSGQSVILEGSEYDCEVAAGIVRNTGLTALATT